ncbi:MAG TPA: VWA domain-containing protein [Candidatus Binataceae bacterium]|nr:VWA domain-containing protein [Candidatus Binataceae bacterium]
MPTALKDLLLGFIGELRSNGVRISVSESLDAMNAVVAASLRRSRMREALRASLIKDETDNVVFDETFNRCFGLEHPGGAPHAGQGARIGVSGGGGGSGAGTSVPQPSVATPESEEGSGEPPSPNRAEDFTAGGTITPKRPKATEADDDPETQSSESSEDAGEGAPEAAAPDSPHPSDINEPTVASVPGSATKDEAPGSVRGLGDAARIQELLQLPFASYTDLEYERARDVLALLKRRLRLRLGRRMRSAARGRIDFRRTIRASIQRGGSFGDLRFRARRPRHIDLLVLTDISGSVRYASRLMLEMVAGARPCFHRVATFVYIDALAEAGFEQGHLVMSPLLDDYARSDFGRVLDELLRKHAETLTRATVLVIMGDGRNNRRPARADSLREISRRVRAVIWLNPEPIERWGSGDSAIRQYEREVDALLYCANLRALESAIVKIV